MNQDLYRYYSHFYTKQVLLETYKEKVHPIPNQATWKIPHEEQHIQVDPPQSRIKARRLKKKRIRAPWENGNKTKCEKCGQLGHNKKTYRNAPKKN